MQRLGLTILLISSLALPAYADNRSAVQPVIINPSAPTPVRAGTGNGPLVILVGDAAKQQVQQQQAAAKALRHKRKVKARTLNMSFGAH